MELRPQPIRFMTAMFLGLSAAGACGAAMPENDPVGSHPGRSTAHVSPDDDSPEALAKKAAKEKDAGADGPNCPHGALEDPHRGFVRCLQPDEKDAGWLPPAPQPEPPSTADAGSDAAPAPDAAPDKSAQDKPSEKPAPEKPAPEKPQPPPIVTVSAPKFEGGEVPRAEKFLNGQLEGIAKCIATNGGLTGKKGSVKLSFLVRARGRAEGVEVASSKGISDDAGGCIRVLLKNRAVGAPSADPVGVTVTFTLEPGKAK
jgi:outer membrane biosynthesis protein TonB